jgi:drug/metabolite transporter (DMT)-like permease
MLNLGILATLLSTLFGGLSSMLMKKVSNEYEDNYLALVYQYIAMAIAALGLGALWARYHGSAFLPSLSMVQR